jgi:DNA-binding transcriptional LysR family regulator
MNSTGIFRPSCDRGAAQPGSVPVATGRCGSADHAADHILPPIVTELGATSPALSVRFRFDRTTPLNEALDRGIIDLAVFITGASAQTGADRAAAGGPGRSAEPAVRAVDQPHRARPARG